MRKIHYANLTPQEINFGIVNLPGLVARKEALWRLREGQGQTASQEPTQDDKENDAERYMNQETSPVNTCILKFYTPDCIKFSLNLLKNLSVLVSQRF